MFPPSLFLQQLEDLFQAFDLSLRLFEVNLERLAQWRRGRGLRELRERLGELLFAVVRVA